ncbi:EamA family transporter [Halobacteriales archaeon QS_4_62_28]|nr:MAG: EamA family transporter [Halobacteriales archaeon QS_4_62_28]
MIERRTPGLFAVVSLFFGGTFVAAKAGLDYFPPLLFVALRFDVAALVLAGYVVATNSRDALIPRTWDDAAGILATGVLAIGLTNALLFVGQQYATSAVGAIVFSLNPILTPVFAAVLLADERLSTRGTAGLVLGVVGVGLVVSPDPANLLAGGIGKVILFAGAISGALGSVLVRWSDGNLTSSVRTAWGLPFGALLCHLLSLAAGESATTVTWSSEAILALGYVGIVAGAVAYIAYFDLLDTAGAIHANLVFYVVPVVATLGGWALLSESVSGTAIAGFLTIFAGFAVLGSDSFEIPAVWNRDDIENQAPVCEEPHGFKSD